MWCSANVHFSHFSEKIAFLVTLKNFISWFCQIIEQNIAPCMEKELQFAIKFLRCTAIHGGQNEPETHESFDFAYKLMTANHEKDFSITWNNYALLILSSPLEQFPTSTTF
jgi:hypothetical protein